LHIGTIWAYLSKQLPDIIKVFCIGGNSTLTNLCGIHKSRLPKAGMFQSNYLLGSSKDRGQFLSACRQINVVHPVNYRRLPVQTVAGSPLRHTHFNTTLKKVAQDSSFERKPSLATAYYIPCTTCKASAHKPLKGPGGNQSG